MLMGIDGCLRPTEAERAARCVYEYMITSTCTSTRVWYVYEYVCRLVTKELVPQTVPIVLHCTCTPDSR